MHEVSKLHENNFPPREQKKTEKKIYKNKLKDKLIKNQKKKVTDWGWGLWVTVLVKIKITNKNYY